MVTDSPPTGFAVTIPRARMQLPNSTPARRNGAAGHASFPDVEHRDPALYDALCTLAVRA